MRSAFTESTAPARAHHISGVSPVVGARFGLAPAPSSDRMTAALEFAWHATHSGVTPASVTALTFARARISVSTVAASS
jgi:hypothetical protein